MGKDIDMKKPQPKGKGFCFIVDLTIFTETKKECANTPIDHHHQNFTFMETLVSLGNEFVVQISANLKYIKTYNYDLFKFYPSNRPPEHWLKIKESIEKQDLTYAQPILIDKDGYIIDGQGRFEACKALKMPVYAFCMLDANREKGESYISILNSYQKNWSANDYLHYYCSKNYQDYKRVQAIIDETGFTVGVICSLWQASTVKSGRAIKTAEVFKTGSYPFPKIATTRVRYVKNIYDAVIDNKSIRVELSGKNALIKGISSILSSGARVSELRGQLNKFGYLIENCGSQGQYFEMLAHIYNYKKRHKNKIAFKHYSFKKGKFNSNRAEFKL